MRALPEGQSASTRRPPAPLLVGSAAPSAHAQVPREQNDPFACTSSMAIITVNCKALMMTTERQIDLFLLIVTVLNVAGDTKDIENPSKTRPPPLANSLESQVKLAHGWGQEDLPILLIIGICITPWEQHPNQVSEEDQLLFAGLCDRDQMDPIFQEAPTNLLHSTVLQHTQTVEHAGASPASVALMSTLVMNLRS
ncbi:hypothetical protein P7K49_022070 [Saguinus oedipus]|uniref:Uncharacterized protein n=1 Tax=Saguinus oedipus TaxID=9490 RepID=A0ABQ9UUK0_SAGOE|nr:hypothetical protein P7K49_022070 [Saguinus oedipus]